MKTAHITFQTKKATSGFTIVELLIVIVVIAILAAITIVAYNGIQQRARDTTRLNDVASMKKALSLYKADNNDYPISVANPGSSTWEISTDPGFLSSLSGYTSTTFKAPGQTIAATGYWYHSFPAGSGCPASVGRYAVIWVYRMETQDTGIIKNQCAGGTLFTTTPEKGWYVEYLY